MGVSSAHLAWGLWSSQPRLGCSIPVGPGLAPPQRRSCLVPIACWDAKAGCFMLQKKPEVSAVSGEIRPVLMTLRVSALALGRHHLPGSEVCWVVVA